MSGPFPTCYLDGTYLPLAQARISPLDRGFLFADGVYEVLPAYGRRQFRAQAHFDRLQNSLAAIGMHNPHSHEQWHAILQGLVERADANDVLLYLQVTRGTEPSRNQLIPENLAPTVFAYASPFPWPSEAALRDGLRGVTVQDIRWQRCDIKSVALLANVLLRHQATVGGGDEAILTRDGLLVEGSSSSVIVCRNGALRTPPDGHHILPSTTRDALLELANGVFPIEQRPITIEELRAADEAWIASAGRGVLPMTQVDGMPIGNGKPGPAWEWMHSAFRRHIAEIAATPAL